MAPACALQAVTSLCATVLLILGRADIRLRITLEFGGLWIATLLLSVNFGLNIVAIMYNVAVILYLPRTIGLVLPLIECPAKLYWRAILMPIVITAFCIGFYFVLKNAFAVSEIDDLLIGAGLAVFGIGASALLQRRTVLNEFALWRTSNLHLETTEADQTHGIQLGHPFGAAGARILTTLLYEMQRRDSKKALATLCIGGGLGIAMCIERR